MLLLGVSGNKLILCDWIVNDRIAKTLRRISRFMREEQDDEADILDMAGKQLEEYFTGRRKEFDLPLHAYGTEFQKKVWKSLSSISFGEVVSYIGVAERVGQPEAVRAVANAIGANPLSILIPCHRVIGSDGKTGGYAGGKDAKMKLLRHEDPTRSF